MIALINTNPEKYNKSFLRMLFSKIEEDEFYLCYRRDNVDKIDTYISFDSFFTYYDGFTKVGGIYIYDENNRSITNKDTGERIDINNLTYNEEKEYNEKTNTIWVGCELKDDEFYRSYTLGLYLLSDTNKDIINRNVEIFNTIDGPNIEIIQKDYYCDSLLSTLKKNNKEITENTTILFLYGITKEIDLLTGKIKYSGLENLDKYKEVINYTGEIKKEILEEYREICKQLGIDYEY